MIIEKSTAKDIPNIMAIIADAQKLLASLHIDQWQDGYPDTTQITKDILNQESYIVKNTTGEIVATFMFSIAGEPTYAVIDGNWITTTETKYGVIHRIAVAEGQTNKGLARFILEHCEQVLRDKAIPSMRIDTHEDNLGMQHILKTENYMYCGIIHLTRGSTRLAYEKIIV